MEKGDVPSLAKPEDILRVEKEFEKKGLINKKGEEEKKSEGLAADGPARNTRSRSRTPGPQAAEESESAATGASSGTGAKRRTRKA